MAAAFFSTLRTLPKPEFVRSFGNLADTEKILQILTNASYVEMKNHQVIRRDSEDIVDNDQVKSYYPGGNKDDENLEDEGEDGAQYLDLEDRKILSKRKKRVGKVEDVFLDLESFFASKKRFKPSSPASTTDSEKQLIKVHHVERESLRIKMLENYLSELPEQKYTQEQILNYLKYLVKDI